MYRKQEAQLKISTKPGTHVTGLQSSFKYKNYFTYERQYEEHLCTWGHMFSVSLYKILLNLQHSRFRQICCLRGRVVISHPIITVKYYESISLTSERNIVFC
jgi:hypothetical protein